MHEEQRGAMLQMLGASVEDWASLEPAHSEDDLTGRGPREREGGSPDFFRDSQGPAGRVAGNMGK